MGVGGHCHTLVALHPGKTQYPLYRRLGGPQSRSGQVREISPQPEFDPQTVQPIASHYANWAIPVYKLCSGQRIINNAGRKCEVLAGFEVFTAVLETFQFFRGIMTNTMSSQLDKVTHKTTTSGAHRPPTFTVHGVHPWWHNHFGLSSNSQG
jgi:hypothetical protein